jgi:hypothetical protein
MISMQPSDFDRLIPVVYSKTRKSNIDKCVY